MSAAWVLIPAAMGAGSAAYQWLGAWLAAGWLRESTSPADYGVLPPVTLLRPIKAGVPHLRGKLERLARAMRPGDQLVLGAASGSPEIAECEGVGAAFADREIVVVRCDEGAALNPKISKLVQMEAACRHERLILSDSEAIIDSGWLDALRHEWESSGAGALTTGYRIIGARSWPQRFDAAAALLSFWPGLAIVRRWGRVNFTLGACTCLRRADLASAGGWRAFGDFLAEDRELGAALAARGCAIRLASAVTTLEIDPLSWRDWWRHQRRVAVTYRVGAPAGFAGMLLTHGAAAALALAAAPVEIWTWCAVWAAVTLLVRWLAAQWLAQTLRFPAPALAISLLAAGGMETITWALSWLSTKVWWSGSWRRVGADGRFVRQEPITP